MNPLLEAALGKIVRYGLMIAAGYLVKRGIWTSEDAASYVAAAAVAIVTLGWSVWVTSTSRKRLLAALALPAGSTERDAAAAVKAGVVNLSVVPKLEPETKGKK